MKGLYSKYTIINNETGQESSGFVFLLKPESDPAARAALRAYIEAIHTSNPHLAADLSYELQRIEHQQTT